MHMVRPTRASCIGISQQRRAPFRDGNSVTSAQENSIKIKEEFVNLLAGEEVLSGPCACSVTNSAWLSSVLQPDRGREADWQAAPVIRTPGTLRPVAVAPRTLNC